MPLQSLLAYLRRTPPGERLVLATRLADGSSLRLAVERKAERLDHWKGTKRRFRDRVQDRVLLDLQVPGLSGRQFPPLDGGEKVLVRGDRLRVVSRSPRARRTTRRPLQGSDLASAQPMLGLLLQVYRRVRV